MQGGHAYHEHNPPDMRRVGSCWRAWKLKATMFLQPHSCGAQVNKLGCSTLNNRPRIMRIVSTIPNHRVMFSNLNLPLCVAQVALVRSRTLSQVLSVALLYIISTCSQLTLRHLLIVQPRLFPFEACTLAREMWCRLGRLHSHNTHQLS